MRWHDHRSDPTGDDDRSVQRADFARLGIPVTEWRPEVIRKAATKHTEKLARKLAHGGGDSAARQLTRVSLSTYRLLDPRRRTDDRSRALIGRSLDEHRGGHDAVALGRPSSSDRAFAEAETLVDEPDTFVMSETAPDQRMSAGTAGVNTDAASEISSGDAADVIGSPFNLSVDLWLPPQGSVRATDQRSPVIRWVGGMVGVALVIVAFGLGTRLVRFRDARPRTESPLRSAPADVPPVPTSSPTQIQPEMNGSVEKSVETIDRFAPTRWADPFGEIGE